MRETIRQTVSVNVRCAALAAALLLVCSACGGGGGGGGGSGAGGGGNGDGGGGNGNGSGTPASWQGAQALETVAGANSSDPAVAADGLGNAFAVWKAPGPEYDDVWAARYVAGSGWTAAQAIDTEELGDVFDPQVAADADGNALVVWMQSDGPANNVWARRYVAGTGWAVAEEIDSDIDTADAPARIAMDGSGNAVVVWSQDSASTVYNIWANRFDAGAGTWGGAELLAMDTTDDAVAPSVAMDGAGNAIAVWLQKVSGDFQIWSNRHNKSFGLWEGPLTVQSDAVGLSQPGPGVAADGAGNAVAVWADQAPTNGDRIYASVYTAGAAWGAVQPLAFTGADPLQSAADPVVAMGSAGNAVAVWEQDEGAFDSLAAQPYVAGAWGTATEIDGTLTEDADDPRIVMNGAGTGFVIFERAVGAVLNTTWVARFSGGAFEAPVRLDASPGQAADGFIAVNGSGHAFAVWRQTDLNGDRSIWANVFR